MKLGCDFIPNGIMRCEIDGYLKLTSITTKTRGSKEFIMRFRKKVPLPGVHYVREGREHFMELVNHVLEEILEENPVKTNKEKE